MTELKAHINDILILSWSATGRARKVANELTNALAGRGVLARHHDASRGETVKFSFHRFFSLFTSVVLGKVPPDFQPWIYTPENAVKPRLLVLVWPIWFLSVPAFVTNSLSNISKTWGGVPVLTVVTCRRAWISAAQGWRLQLEAHNLPFCGISVLRESRPGLLSFFLTPWRILFRPANTSNLKLETSDLTELQRIASVVQQTSDWNTSRADTELGNAIRLDSLASGEAVAYQFFQAYAKFLARRRWVAVDGTVPTAKAVNFLTMFFILVVGLSLHILPLNTKSGLRRRQLRANTLRQAE